ncbi:amidohydrolase [Pseudomonas protegens]|uniref:amidohydrolase n=1 Tax=Pseudomonas protegens TaxID=380021 RepID=UPI0039064E25
MSRYKAFALDWVERHRQQLSDWHQIIWHYAEPAFREYKSCAWYVQLLEAEGFTVERGSGGMPTAFCATFTQGQGPLLATYGEYDAVPGNCQAATTRKQPRDGLSRFAPGHTDPHSALGISALGGAPPAKAPTVDFRLQGRSGFFGEPAEKLRASKPVHAAKGYYDDLDAAISFHPTYMLPLNNTTTWDTHCGIAYAYIYSFTCEDPQNWIAADRYSPIPQNHLAARAPGANDALVHFYTLNESLRRSTLPFTGLWSYNEAILTAGQATADNLPPHLSQIQYLLRCDSIEQAETISQVMDNNAAAAAMATGCRWKKTWVCKSRGGLPNHVMAQATYDNLAAVGAPQWDEEAREIAREIQRNLGLEAMDQPFLPATEELIEPQECERQMRLQMPAWQNYLTSDDYPEYTWHCPTVRLLVARPMLSAPPGTVYPDWVSNALGGIRQTIDPMIEVAAKTIAATLVDLLTDEALLSAAKAEFVERTGGGIGGSRWQAPLLPEDFKVPHDFRWPEYISTARGEEWWIPARADE